MFDNGNHILNFYNREYFLSFILHCDVEDYNFSNHIVHKDLWSPLHLHHRICCRHISHLFDMYNNATATVSNEMFKQKQCIWNFRLPIVDTVWGKLPGLQSVQLWVCAGIWIYNCWNVWSGRRWRNVCLIFGRFVD